MKIVPVSSVDYLRPYACSFKSDCYKCPSFGKNCHFPHPYKATDEDLRSVPYLAELWGDENNNLIKCSDDEAVIISFDDVNAEFESMKNEPNSQVSDYGWHTVYDYLRDCIDQGLHPVSVKE